MKQATQTFRTIEHTDGHTDIEQLFVTSFPDSDGKMITSQVWAVIQCGQKQEKQAMTYATPKQTITTREYLQALSDKGYTVISPDVMTVQDVLYLYEQLDSLRDSLRDANEGAKLMHSLATGGESRLDADLAAMLQWEDEKPVAGINWQNYPDFEDEPKEAQPKIDFNSIPEIKF